MDTARPASPAGRDRHPDAHPDISRPPARRSARPWLALTADVALVVGFVAAGRQEHGTVDGLPGLLVTASPFLVGLLAGSLLTRFPRTWAYLWPHGAIVWLTTLGLGLALRVWWGLGGAPLSFVLVAAGVLAVTLLGRRAASRVVGSR